jgi:hypothetical protein
MRGAPKDSSVTTRINWCGSDFSPRFSIRPLIAHQIAGGVAAGAAAIGGYAYHQHQKHKNDEDEVSCLLHSSNIPLLTLVEETSPTSGTAA